MSVEVRGDAVTVTLAAPGVGETIWTFDAIEVKRKDFDCQIGLTVSANVPGFDDPFPMTHFSGASASARDTFRRLLDGFYGKDVDWARLLPRAYAMAREAYLSASQTVDLSEVSLDWEEAWWVDGLWPHEGVTILFGQGSHGKGHVTTALSMAVAAGGMFLGHQCREGSVLYLDYEATQRVLARRLNRHVMGSDGMQGAIHYMNGRAIPVADQIEAVGRELQRTGSGALIVDSAIPAVGGDPSKPEIVGRMINALNTLRVPVWLLAHVTKAGEDEYPFGSVFWHNLARMTWFIKKVGDEDRPDVEVALFNRKINEGRLQKSFGARITFDDPTGPIHISPYEISREPEFRKSLSIGQQMWGVLTVPKTTSALATELNQVPSSIRTAGGRMKSLHSSQLPGEKEATWSRASVHLVESAS